MTQTFIHPASNLILIMLPQVERLPKTISQKILRNMMVAIVNNKPYKVSPTIDDPTVVGEIVECVESWREGVSN